MDSEKNHADCINRVILHVDLDSFFATAAQQANPGLRKKPVGIVKAKGRSCIIAASKEAKKYGVKTGSSVFEAKKLCPSIILVCAEFEKYEDITYRFIEICQKYSPICEVFSLDECFVDITDTEKLWSNAVSIALEIQERLALEIGDYLTCSVGISHNRLLAKLASTQAKPDGIYYLDKKSIYEALDKADLTDVCGIGSGLYRRLISAGIGDFKTLRVCSLNFLYKYFGPFWSEHLYNLARGIDNSEVIPSAKIPEAKSVGRTYTTHRNLYKKDEIERLIRNLAEEAAEKTRKMQLAGRYVGLSLRGGEKSFYGHKTLKTYINDGNMLFKICQIILKEWSGEYVRFCGVTLSMLTKNEYLSKPLFPEDQRRKNLITAVDRINNNFGTYTIFPGQLLKTEIIRPEVTGYFGDKKFRLNFLRNN